MSARISHDAGTRLSSTDDLGPELDDQRAMTPVREKNDQSLGPKGSVEGLIFLKPGNFGSLRASAALRTIRNAPRYLRNDDSMRRV